VGKGVKIFLFFLDLAGYYVRFWLKKHELHEFFRRRLRPLRVKGTLKKGVDGLTLILFFYHEGTKGTKRNLDAD